MLALGACADEPAEHTTTAAATEDGLSTPIARLPFIDSTTNPDLLAELLDRPTVLGETTALQVRLPPPHNRELTDSLVRVIGDVDAPHVLFRSNALVELGVIPKSPGPDFFTAFVTLDRAELDRVAKNQDEIASGAFGEVTNESVVFDGRHAIGRTINAKIEPSAFTVGSLVPINRCFFRPVSTQKAWDQSLFITSPQVVLDPTRTWDPCTGAGTKGSVWTYAHLMREMANGSGLTPEDFVKNWLSMWLNNYTVNGDVVPARTQMFNQVIQPWATASGVTATLVTNPLTGVKSVSLTGPLDLDIAPFRLEAIVNRLDLGETTGGGGGYGNVTGTPRDAGELRFIFGVVQPNPWGAGTDATCGKKLFTTIFEYGVPIKGCANVVAWARKWSSLQAFPGFTAAYLAQLQSMTESVVLHGAAPAKGNQNAINQIRTNEIALGLSTGRPWELREFTLTNEIPGTPGSNNPINGPLRAHTVAQTPNDGPFGVTPNMPIDMFVTGPVMAGLQLPAVLPTKCFSKYTVPFQFGGQNFRGGNALVGPGAPPGVNFWLANVPFTAEGVCARHDFSLNTCNGCHRGDSGTNGLGGSTNFTHINPLSTIPVTLSKFLTGGGPGLTFGVNDTQFGGAVPQWQFADLDRRLQRLFDISHCTPCAKIFPATSKFVDTMQTFGPVPADLPPDQPPTFKVGPITDLPTVKQLLDLRPTTVGPVQESPADVFRPAPAPVH